MKTTRQPTAKELRWFSNLRKVLAAMPDTVECLVRSGRTITLHERGATLASLDEFHNSDNVPELDVDSIVAPHVIPNSEDA